MSSYKIKFALQSGLRKRKKDVRQNLYRNCSIKLNFFYCQFRGMNMIFYDKSAHVFYTNQIVDSVESSLEIKCDKIKVGCTMPWTRPSRSTTIHYSKVLGHFKVFWYFTFQVWTVQQVALLNQLLVWLRHLQTFQPSLTPPALKTIWVNFPIYISQTI